MQIKVKPYSVTENLKRLCGAERKFAWFPVYICPTLKVWLCNYWRVPALIIPNDPSNWQWHGNYIKYLTEEEAKRAEDFYIKTISGGFL